MAQTATMLEMAESFFGEVQKSPQGQEELKRFDGVIEFELTDDQPFQVVVKGGKLSVKKGLLKSLPEVGVRFTTDREVVVSLFRGKRRFTEVYDWTKRLPDPGEGKGKLYSDKFAIGSPVTKWAAKLIRMGQELR